MASCAIGTWLAPEPERSVSPPRTLREAVLDAAARVPRTSRDRRAARARRALQARRCDGAVAVDRVHHQGPRIHGRRRRHREQGLRARRDDPRCLHRRARGRTDRTLPQPALARHSRRRSRSCPTPGSRSSDTSITRWSPRSASRTSATGWARRPSSRCLTALCNARFSAFQYALLSALASLGRIFLGPVSGGLADIRRLGAVLRHRVLRGAARDRCSSSRTQARARGARPAQRRRLSAHACAGSQSDGIARAQVRYHEAPPACARTSASQPPGAASIMSKTSQDPGYRRRRRLALVIVAAVAVSLLFDPNDYKDEITAQVKAAHGPYADAATATSASSFFPGSASRAARRRSATHPDSATSPSRRSTASTSRAPAPAAVRSASKRAPS